MSEPWSLILAAFVTGLLTYGATRLTKPRITREAESLAVASVERALKVSNQRIDDLESAVAGLKVEMAQMMEERDHHQRGTDILRGQVRELGGVPRWPT